MVATHRHLPFHVIELYKNRSFHATSLYELGMVIHLGHGGNECPCKAGLFVPGDPLAPEEEDSWEDDPETDDLRGRDTQESQAARHSTLVLVDRAGVHKHAVRFCRCDTREGDDLQLLQSKLFPASFTRPGTAFTFRLLDEHAIESVECKTAPLNYWSKLKRFTNNAFPNTVPVSVRANIN